MKNEKMNRSAELNDEQLEQVAGGANIRAKCPKCGCEKKHLLRDGKELCPDCKYDYSNPGSYA